MNTAADGRSGKLISAEEALRGVTYQCPCCKGRVYLRGGWERVRHFAHLPGEGTPECWNFHPNDPHQGSPSRHQSGDLRRSAERPYWLPLLSTPELYLTVPSDPVGNSVWRLEVLVPRTQAQTLVNVDDASRGQVQFQCASLPAGGRRVELTPKTGPYRLTVVSSADPIARHVLETPIPGLIDEFNLFQWSETAGRRLSRGEPVTWGEQYRVLLRAGAQFRSPDEVRHALIGTRVGWSCIEFRLPNSPDGLVAKWVTDKFRRSIRSASAQLTLLSPTPISLDEDGGVVVEASREVILAIHGRPGCVHPGDLLVLPGTGNGFAYPCGKDLPILISLGKITAGRVDVAFTNVQGAVLTLRTVGSVELANPPEVALTACGRDGSDQWALGIQSEKVGALLKAVRAGRVTLTGIVAPPRARGRLAWSRVGRDAEELSVGGRRASVTENWRVDPGTLGRLSRALRHADVEVTIDFHGFGRATLATSGLSEPSAMPSFNKFPQIRWLQAIAAGRQSDARAMTLPGGPEMGKTAFAGLKRLVQQGRVSRRLEPQIRAVVRKISQNAPGATDP